MKEEKYYCTPHQYPPEIVEFAERRTEDLLHSSRIARISIKNLITSAYLIGLMDSHQVNQEKEHTK